MKGWEIKVINNDKKSKWSSVIVVWGKIWSLHDQDEGRVPEK